MLTEVIGIATTGRGVGLLGFHEPDVFPDFLRGNGFIQAIAHQQWFAQVIEAEIAARPLHGVFPLSVATDHALDALGGDAVGVVHHFYEDKLAVSAVRLVHAEDSVGGSAGTGEGIEDDVITRSRNLQNSLNCSNGLRIRKIFFFEA